MLEHRNMANLLYDQFTNSGIDFKTNVLQYASPAFDVCYQELFSALLSGGTLHIVPESIKRDAAQLFSFINKHQTDIVFFPTAFAKMLFNEESYAYSFPRCVKHLITAGEQLTVSRLFQKVLRTHGLHLHNHYGPSETHVVSTYTIQPGDDIPEYPPIGKPICHNNMYVISKNKQLQPLGIAGELYISGANTGRGYVNNPALTGEKFLPDPFREGAVMYRTGDLARSREDGQIEYLGRIDDQAKIRGYRIEPKEVEVILANHPAVREATVLIQKNALGENELCAYCGVSKATDPSALRKDLAKNLPDYMIPVKWAFVESIPLTANGKVDRKALPAPEGGVQTGGEYVAPRTAAEARLAHIWKEVLGLPRIGVKDNFFDIGGHSARATTLTAKAHKEMGVSLPAREVFRSPTIEEMAETITGMKHTAYTSIPTVDAKEYYAVSSAQKRLYILNQLKGGELSYNMPSVMRADGALDRELVEKAIRKLIQRHETAAYRL
nr:AMP-binding protein [Bacillus velezensis]